MKKTLIAIAALAATSAFAQSTVTMYGNLDQSVFRSHYNTDNAISSASNAGSTSLWGIKGMEDLGGGTRASFDLKSELTLASGQTGSASTGVSTGAAAGGAANAGSSTSNVFNRAAFLGLANDNMGDFKIGRQNDSWWETTTRFNNTGVNSFGWANATAAVSGSASAGLMTAGTATAPVAPAGLSNNGAASTATDLNAGSVGTGQAFFGGLSYQTPTWKGLNAKYAKGVQKPSYSTSGDVGNVASMSVNYTQGPLDVGFARTQRNDSQVANNGSKLFQNTMLGGAYTYGDYTFKAAINQTRYSGSLAADSSFHDMNTTAFGVGYQLSAKTKLDVGYTVIKDIETTANKFTQLGVNATYSFSKRTSVYAGYGTGKNEGAARFTNVYGGTALVKTDGSNNTVTSILTGIRHQF